MSVTRGTLKGVYGESNPQDLRDMAKAERLHARFQWLIAGPLIDHAYAGPADKGSTEYLQPEHL
jgi:hypothetical protein